MIAKNYKLEIVMQNLVKELFNNMENKKIIGLTTCHNRKQLTLNCLRSLDKQELPPQCKLEICLVDDGCSDGTGNAVKTEFPDATVLKGDGNLFWAGGMRFGWYNYVCHQNWDWLLVFNDDIELYPKALLNMLSTAKILEEKEECYKYAIAGAFLDPITKETSYGGVIKDCWWYPVKTSKITPNGIYQECDSLNMNCALISSNAINSIGFLSSDFTHKRADYDFGFRLTKNCGKVFLVSNYVGECSRNRDEKQTKIKKNIFKAWQEYVGIKGQNPKERMSFLKRHGGICWFIYWIIPYLIFFPKHYFLKIKNFHKNQKTLN